VHVSYSIIKIEYFIERVQLLLLHWWYALHKLLTLLIPYVYVLPSDANLSLLELYDGAPSRIINIQVNGTVWNINFDGIAIFNQTNRTAFSSFWRNVTN
jgi:hypothetical protein